MDTVLVIVFALLTLAFIMSFVRLVLGPSLPDRVVSLDLLGMIIAGMLSAYIIWMGQPVLLDVVTILALISFFGTVAFARYLERRGSEND